MQVHLYDGKNLETKCINFIYENAFSDFIWPFLRPYMGVIPNPKMALIFPISCVLALIFPILIKYFPKCEGKGSFPKSQINSLALPVFKTEGITKLYANCHIFLYIMQVHLYDGKNLETKCINFIYENALPVLKTEGIT